MIKIKVKEKDVIKGIIGYEKKYFPKQYEKDYYNKLTPKEKGEHDAIKTLKKVAGKLIKMNIKRVYVAGNYNADNIIKALDNVKRGTYVCVRLLKKGYIPFCPWLDYNFHWFGDLTIKDYYRYSMGWLEVSDCIYVLKNGENSKGTQAEIKRAVELGIPVMYEGVDLL